MSKREPGGHGEFVVRVAASTLRVLAGLIDLAVPASLTVLACFLSETPDLSRLPPRYWNYLDYTVDVFNSQPSVFIVPALYFVALYVLGTVVFVSTIGNTPFSRLVGIRVTDRRGRGIGPIRSFFWTVCGLLLGVVAFVGPLWTIVDPKRRMLHDILAGVVVVFGRPVVTMVTADPDEAPVDDIFPAPEEVKGDVNGRSAGGSAPWHAEGGNW